MLRKNGQNYNANQWDGGGYNQWAIVSESYGGRTVWGLDVGAATTASGCFAFNSQKYGSCTLSDAAEAWGFVFRARLAFETLNTSVGSATLITWVEFVHGPYTSLRVYLDIYNDAGTYKLRVRSVYGGSNALELGTIVAGTTFYEVELHVFNDVIKGYFNGAYVNELTHPQEASEAYVSQFNTYFANTYDVKWDNLYLDMERLDYTTTLGYVYGNNNPMNGTVWMIKKTYLDAGVTSGDIFELTVSDGAFSPGTSDPGEDYLFVFVDDDNDAGYAAKMDYSSGFAWSKDW